MSLWHTPFSFAPRWGRGSASTDSHFWQSAYGRINPKHRVTMLLLKPQIKGGNCCMANTLVSETMVNMKWPDIKAGVDNNALVLLPIGVIEEHGPHLCLGTDIYIAHLQCLLVKHELEKRGRKALIAPPFYWGVCQATGGFIGSFRVRKETAKALLVDMIASLAEFGFRDVYGINAHGDIAQNMVLLEAFREAAEDSAINARIAFPADRMHHFGLGGSETYVCPVRPQTISIGVSDSPDVHAGDIETAIMYAHYPHLTDAAVADSLPPVGLDNERIMTWLLGGHASEISPLGYLGAPGAHRGVQLTRHLEDVTDRIYAAIMASLSNA